MKNPIILLFLVFGLLLASCNNPKQSSEQQTTEQEANEKASATATMNPASGSEVRGTATFEQTDNGVKMTLELTGLQPNGVHALHLHEVGDCSAPDATSAGGHWNPTSSQHGHRDGDQQAFHRGDIDNIKADGEGKTNYSVTVEDWTIGGAAETNIIGKSVIVHVNQDDFKSQPTGNAGDRISCGVIEEKK